jgi:hypothetical protein
MTVHASERVTPMSGREPTGVKIARLEETLSAVREDVADIKASVEHFNHRVGMLEDVRVRALEDWRIREQAVREERARAADAARAAADAAQAAAEQAAEDVASHTEAARFRITTVAGYVAAVAAIAEAVRLIFG